MIKLYNNETFLVFVEDKLHLSKVKQVRLCIQFALSL